MKSFGPLYVDKIRYWHKHTLPIVEKGWTRETEFPYRGGKCLVFRLPWTEPGFVLGLWTERPKINREDDEAIDDLIASALRASGDRFKAEEIGEWDV